MASPPITVISSMATRQALAELAAAYAERAGRRVEVESVGGVDAARRVQAGEAFDLVVLASDAIDRLAAAGAVRADSRVDVVRSPMAVAVRAGAPHPDLRSEAALRRALQSSDRIGYSTGPSGNHVLHLFERWGWDPNGRPRLVQAPPGVPVGRMVANAEVDLGFQQLSELMHLDGIEVAGVLPDATAFVTTFTGAVCSRSAQPAAAAEWLAWLASAPTAAAKRRHGMEPA